MQHEPADHACGGSPPTGDNAREGVTQDPSSELPSKGEGVRLGDRAACPHLSLSRLSHALAGEIGREPVHAEDERELAAVVQVMHNLVGRAGAPGSSQLAYAFTSSSQSSPRNSVNQPARQPMMCRALAALIGSICAMGSAGCVLVNVTPWGSSSTTPSKGIGKGMQGLERGCTVHEALRAQGSLLPVPTLAQKQRFPSLADPLNGVGKRSSHWWKHWKPVPKIAQIVTMAAVSRSTC